MMQNNGSQNSKFVQNIFLLILLWMSLIKWHVSETYLLYTCQNVAWQQGVRSIVVTLPIPMILVDFLSNYYKMKAIICGLLEHEQIIFIRSNRHMKPLVDWLSNPHWTPDTGMLTYLLSAMAPKRTETTPAQYIAVSRNSPLISWTWEDRRYTRTSLLKANEAHLWRRGTYPQVLITSNPVH